MTTDLHSLMGPYALDALDSHERARFETHLDQCADCRAELAGFEATAARLGEAAGQAPPPGLRERLLAQVSSTAQERPVVTALAQRSKLRRTLPRLAVAAAFLIGAVGVGGYVIERDQANEARDRSVAIESVLSSADASTTTTAFPTGGNVRLISSTTQDSAVLFARDLPNPGKDKVYQVWMITGSSPTSQGTFVDHGTMVMKGVSGADQVAVTIEPKGGSEQPTTPPVATIPL